MSSSLFSVKQGMVFYLEDPALQQPLPCVSSYTKLKKRPFVVVSNDKCNDSSQLVHVAPCTTKPPVSEKWYYVPFKRYGGSMDWVDVGQIMLIPKKQLTIANYSEAISKYTVNNKDFLTRLEMCCAKQMGCELKDNYLYKNEEEEQMSTESVKTTPQTNITVNVNGLESLMSVIQSYIDVKINEKLSALTEGVEKKDTVQVDEKPAPCKEVETPTSCEKAETPESVVITQPPAKVETWSRRFEIEKVKELEERIKQLSKYFNGTLSNTLVAMACDVSLSTIGRYIKRIKKNGHIYTTYGKYKKK